MELFLEACHLAAVWGGGGWGEERVPTTVVTQQSFSYMLARLFVVHGVSSSSAAGFQGPGPEDSGWELGRVQTLHRLLPTQRQGEFQRPLAADEWGKFLIVCWGFFVFWGFFFVFFCLFLFFTPHHTLSVIITRRASSTHWLAALWKWLELHKEDLCSQTAPRTCANNGKQVSGGSGMMRTRR